MSCLWCGKKCFAFYCCKEHETFDMEREMGHQRIQHALFLAVKKEKDERCLKGSTSS